MVAQMRLPRPSFGSTFLFAIWALFSAVLSYFLKEITGDFASGWVTDEIGARTGIGEAQVKAVISAWLPAMVTVAAAMWLTAFVLRWRSTGAEARGLLPREGRVNLNTESNPAKYSSGDRCFMLRFGKQDGGRVDLQREHTGLAWIASVSGVEAGGAVNIATLNKSSSRCTLMVGDRFLAQNQAGYVMQGRMTNLYRREIDGPGTDEVVFHYRIEAETHPQRVVAI
jgi:hypothetical protein